MRLGYLKILLALLLAFSLQFALAQNRDNNWVFGQYAGLSFNTGTPQPFGSSIFSEEDCASISDTSGQLLFYTNGVIVYARNGAFMPNGTGLATGSPWPYGGDAPQSVIIIPKPGSDSLYYLFTRSDDSLSYSIIDMSVNNGWGDLVVKNHPLYNQPVQRYMTAIKHGNGKYWWLITHGLGKDFQAWEITDTSIEPAVISQVGIVYNYAGFNSHVEIAANLQGTQLAFSSAYGLHLVDFDRCGGTFSNFQTITLTETPYSFAYSPDGTKLYMSYHYNEYPTYLWQLCLDCPPPLDSNFTEIYHQYFVDYDLGQIQNGPDGKIYVEMGYWWSPDTFTSVYNKNLSVINDPNQLGLACDFDTATISLDNNYSFFGLPNSPYYDMPPVEGFCGDSIPIDTIPDTTTLVKNTLPDRGYSTYPNPVSNKLIIQQQGRLNELSFSLFDLNGQVILKENRSSSRSMEVEMSTLSSGVYILQVRNGESQSSYFRIVKE